MKILMTPERWQQVEAVLQDALDLPAAKRESFLNDVCGEDEDLKRDATTLIGAYNSAGEFIEESAIVHDAAVLLHVLPDTNVGRVIGSYRLIERLGTGGMGEVYLAEDTRLPRFVALKILPTYFVSDEARLRRFQSEARAVSALNHPNILTIYEVGREGDADSTHFIATEFIDGKTIRELLEAKSLTLDQILDICTQVGAGLVAAHSAGIIHRDIKPENIMRRQDGLVKLLDFGIAKATEQTATERMGFQPNHTEAGTVLGTVGYMSPEQARGLKVDQRTDVWSLGVVLYEMVAGRGPFKGDTRMDTLVSILEREPDELSNSDSQHLDELQRIIDRSLQKNLEQRYQSVRELLEDLKELRKQVNSDASSPPIQLPLAQSFTRQATNTVNNKPRRLSWQWFAIVLSVGILAASLSAIYFVKQGRQRETAAPTLNSKLYRDMNATEQLTFIEQEEQRISAMMGDQPAKLSEDALKVIKTYVDRYASRTKTAAGSDRNDLETIYQRAVPYIPLIARSFEARKVPITIGIYLPMIESEYEPCYENQFGAKGIFQFLPSTAQAYGVAQSEMCDAEKMTPAAAHYIADRMAELGEDAESITLVILSYNRGEEWVRDTLRELRDAPDYERNFWTMLKHRDKLDKSFNESAGYVPMFFAAAIVGENPKNFELTTPPLSSLAKTR